MDYYTAIIILTMFSMFVIKTCVSSSNTLTEKRKKLFQSLLTIIMVTAFCEWLGNYLQGAGPETRIAHIIVKALELSLVPSIPFFILWIIERKNEKEIAIVLGIHAFIECLSGIFGFIYSVDASSYYTHANFYWIYIAMYIISTLYCSIAILKSVKKYQYSGGTFFLLIVLFFLIGAAMQIIDSSLKVSYITVSITTIMLYVFTLEMIQQTDELTELLNRRGFENYIYSLEKDCIVIFFDVDKFKQANDVYGHAFGDEVLKIIGHTIKDIYANFGKCFRYGGDEFCVILTKNVSKIESLNHDFFMSIEKLREGDERLPRVSIGYSYYNPDNQNIQDTIDEADSMMYKFKELRKAQEKENNEAE